ncbi:MAG: hypothetical protein N2559_13470 [Anaerolineae bacterium]|nr:hypothetical protein [Anaerolineae bacterium]
MAFKVSDLHDLITLLETHPEWRAELRRVVFTEDVLALPRIVQELAEAQKQTEAQVRELAEAQKQTEAQVRELAEAQKRTEEQVRELAALQQRTEQRVEELAAAQQRTEQRVDRLEVVVQELAEAQKRTEQRVDHLGVQVGRLNERLGATLEQEAADVLRIVLEAKGYRVLEEAYSLALDGEVDVVLPLEDPQGQRVWAVLEAKARLGWRTIENWANRMRSEGFQAALQASGVSGPYLVYAYGLRFDLSARKAAEKFGIGLLGDQGEVVPPASPQTS